MDLMGFFSGWVAEACMISHAFAMRWSTASRGVSPSRHSRWRITSEMGSWFSSHRSSSSLADLKSMFIARPSLRLHDHYIVDVRVCQQQLIHTLGQALIRLHDGVSRVPLFLAEQAHECDIHAAVAEDL